MRIKYICYNYGTAINPTWYTGIGSCYDKLHLVRYTNGQGVLVTSAQLRYIPR